MRMPAVAWSERSVTAVRERRLSPRTRRALANPVTATGVAIAALFVLTAVFAPWIAPSPEGAYGSPPGGERLLAPSVRHPFGTDTLGRDIFSRVIVGTRLSVQIIASSVGLATAVGVTVGLVSGYAPRWADDVLMRLTDIFLSVPSLILAMLITVTLGASIGSTIIAIGFTYWPRYARLVRGETLRYRSHPFVEAAAALGASWTRVIRRHLLPTVFPTVLVQASLDSGGVLLTAASLGFLGLGARAPTPEWGLMVAVGRELMPTYWWLSAFPGLAIFAVVVGLNLVGDGLRTLLDPRARTV
jgi:peptide/nickel transport system permease protein